MYSGTAYRAKSVHTSAAANRPDVVDREAVPAYTTPWGAVTVAAWAVSTVYAVGDYVEFNAVIYRVITAHTSADDNDPLDPDRPAVQAIPAYVSPWEEVTLPAWSNSSMYAVGARVSYLGVSYICITDHTATTGNNPAVPSSSGGVAQLATPWEQDATVNAFRPGCRLPASSACHLCGRGVLGVCDDCGNRDLAAQQSRPGSSDRVRFAMDFRSINRLFGRDKLHGRST